MPESIFKYGSDIIWSLPLMFQYEPVYSCIYETLKSYNINLPQACLFGAPHCLWTGGRPNAICNELDKKTLIKIFNYTYKCNAIPTFTFTNCLLSKEDLNDRYANMILETALEYKARFIVYSDLLRDYIKSKDSSAVVVASVNRANVKFCPMVKTQPNQRMEDEIIEAETKYYNDMLKEYDIVVVRPEYSMGPLQENPNLIDDLSRIEVLINQYCVNHCKKVGQHAIYQNSRRIDNPEPFECLRSHLPRPVSLQNYLGHTTEEVEKLTKAGVKHLKLQGRGNPTLVNTMLLSMVFQMFNLDGKYNLIFHDFIPIENLFTPCMEYLNMFDDKSVVPYHIFQVFQLSPDMANKIKNTQTIQNAQFGQMQNNFNVI